MFVPTLYMILALIATSSFMRPGDDPRDDRAIRQALSAHEFKEERLALISFGEKLFPAYERILADKNATRHEIGRIYIVLSAVKADRRRFLERAVASLVDSDSGNRRCAVILLGQIGSERDTAPIVALLSDTEFTVGYAAAETLQAIGGPRDLAAMNTWLAVSKPENYSKEYQGSYETIRKNVTKSRDELKTRLDKAKKKP